VLAVLVLIVFRAAFEVVGTAQPAAPVLWIALVFATVGGLARGFHAEADHGTLDALVASPAGGGQLFLAKAGSGALLAIALGILTLLLAGVLIDTALLWSFAAVVPFVILGAIGLAAVAALVSAISARARARAALMPVVALPLCLPLLLVGVQGTQAAISIFFVAVSPAGALAASAAYDALVIAVGYLITSRALEG
jgi:heme exporter protein B